MVNMYQCKLSVSNIFQASSNQMIIKGSSKKYLSDQSFLSKPPGPNLFMIVCVSSIEQYFKDYNTGSMKSLMLKPSGAETWYMIHPPPSCFGTTPSPEVQEFSNRGFERSQNASSFTLLLKCYINKTRLLIC